MCLPEQLIDIKKLLLSEPKSDPTKSPLMNWKRLGPLTLADIIKNTDQEPDFNSDKIKIKTIKFGKAVGYG